MLIIINIFMAVITIASLAIVYSLTRGKEGLQWEVEAWKSDFKSMHRHRNRMFAVLEALGVKKWTVWESRCKLEDAPSGMLIYCKRTYFKGGQLNELPVVYDVITGQFIWDQLKISRTDIGDLMVIPVKLEDKNA